MEENKIYCSNCGAMIDDDDYEECNGKIICSDCIEQLTVTCDCCGTRVWTEDSYGDEYTTLCPHCYHTHYTRCCSCDALLHRDDAYHLDDEDYCRECYDEESDKCRNIHDYIYKPEPIFYGNNDRYFGVELEIDGAGKDDGNAKELLEIANVSNEHIYIKSDGSLDDGMEIVTHPMSLNYHKNFCWEELMRTAVRQGYRSHQTSTCGRYAAVNLCNYHTVEFRLFRGTLKHNTLIAALELIDKICEFAIFRTDDEMQKMSWSEFVSKVTEPELIQYLKERNLYINDEINAEEDF